MPIRESFEEDRESIAASQASQDVTNDSIRDRYSKDQKIGEGKYGTVFRGTDRETGRTVAIKSFKANDSWTHGLQMDVVREIRALRELQHPNIIQLFDVYPEKSSIHLVLEFLPADLEQIINSSQLFSGPDIKAWMLMLLRGLYHLHRNYMLHRDLKPSNLLLATNGELKIADFGLAREFAEPLTDPRKRPMTPQVVTLWYRAPELLMGAREYGPAIDIWAAGCIFAELFIRHPFIASKNNTDLGQLDEIFRALGTPTKEEWPTVENLPGHHTQNPIPRPDLGPLMKSASADAMDLMMQMLRYDPQRRITAKQALEHPYFRNTPAPRELSLLPKLPVPNTPTSEGLEKKRKFEMDEGDGGSTVNNVPHSLARKLF